MPRATNVASGRSLASYAVILVVTEDDHGAMKNARCFHRVPPSYALTSLLVLVDSRWMRAVPAGAEPLMSCSCGSPVPALKERETSMGSGGGSDGAGVGARVPLPQLEPPPPGTASAR